MRTTSIRAYHELVENGQLGHRQSQAYQVLYHEGPMTQAEVFRRVRDEDETVTMSGVINTRISEMKKVGLVKVVGERMDSKSGKPADLWDVTGQMPQPIDLIEDAEEKIEYHRMKLKHWLEQLNKLQGGEPGQLDWFL